MSHFAHPLRIAVVLVVSLIASPAFAQKKSSALATFLSGHLTAAGHFQNHHDGSTRGVRVDIHGASDGAAFKLVEDTVFSDGEKQHKVWRFSKVGEGLYVGQRADLTGHATVETHDNRINIAYRARVPMKDGNIHDLDFKETLVFTQSGSLLSIPVGEAHLAVRNCAVDQAQPKMFMHWLAPQCLASLGPRKDLQTCRRGSSSGKRQLRSNRVAAQRLRVIDVRQIEKDIRSRAEEGATPTCRFRLYRRRRALVRAP